MKKFNLYILTPSPLTSMKGNKLVITDVTINIPSLIPCIASLSHSSSYSFSFTPPTLVFGFNHQDVTVTADLQAR